MLPKSTKPTHWALLAHALQQFSTGVGLVPTLLPPVSSVSVRGASKELSHAEGGAGGGEGGGGGMCRRYEVRSASAIWLSVPDLR